MKNINNIVLILLLTTITIFIGCNNENKASSIPDSSTQSNAILKNYQAALNSDVQLVNYHQHAGLGYHDSCFYYWHQFISNDSLYSSHFYSYCRTIYANNGGRKYGNGDWNWNYENNGMMNNGMMNNGNYNMMNSGNWQCGLDTLQFQNWNGNGDFLKHDSLMHYKMQMYGMMGYFSNQTIQCYSNMQALRFEHYHKHNYHW